MLEIDLVARRASLMEASEPGQDPIADPVSAGRWEVAAGIAVLGFSVSSQAGLLDETWAAPRVWLAFVAAAVLPGYCLLRLFIPRLRPDSLEVVPLSFAAGFPLQALWCIAMMNLGGNSLLAARLQTLVSTALLIAAYRRGRLGLALGCAAFDARSVFRDTSAFLRMLLVALLLVFACLLSPFVPYAENEEMVIGRKVFDNQVLTYLNVMHRPDEPTTYLYPAYIFFQAVLAHMAHVDVLLANLKIRALLAVGCLLIQYCLVKTLTGRSFPAAIGVLVLLGLAAWDPNSWSYGLGWLVPFNNRYGVAPSILMPLALYLLMLLYRGPASARLVGFWVVFVFSTALVHTKESLQVLAVAVGLLIASLALRARPRREHLALAMALLSVAIVFEAYQLHHHGRVSYMMDLTRKVKDFAGVEIGKLDPVSALGWTRPLVARTYDTAAGGYLAGNFHQVIGGLRSHTVGFYFVLALWILPFLTLLRNWQAVFLWSALSVPLLLIRTPILYLTAARVVGTTDLELIAPLLAQASFLIVATVATGVVALALEMAHRNTRAAAAPLPFLAALSLAGGVASAGFWLIRAARSRLAERLAIDEAGVVGEVLLLAIPISLVAAMLCWRRPRFRLQVSGDSLGRWPLLAAACLFVLSIAQPAPRTDLGLWKFWDQYAWQRGIASLDKDFDKIARVGNFDTIIPQSVFQFVRDRIGPHHIFATTPLELNRILLYTNSYIANAPTLIATKSDVEYFALVKAVGSDPIFNDRELLPIEDVVHWYLFRYGVEYLLVKPDFKQRMELRLPALNHQSRLFEKIYEADGWSIWRVERSALRPPSQLPAQAAR